MKGRMMKFLVFLVLVVVLAVTYVQISKGPAPVVEREKAQASEAGVVRLFTEAAIVDNKEAMKAVTLDGDANTVDSFLMTLHKVEEDNNAQAAAASSQRMGADKARIVFFFAEDKQILCRYTFMLEEKDDKFWIKRTILE
jgi:hypothetical protein